MNTTQLTLQGGARHGAVRQGEAGLGMARRGLAGHGNAMQGHRASTPCALYYTSRSGEAALGVAGPGSVRQRMARKQGAIPALYVKGE